MKRIFLMLVLFSTALSLAALVLGLQFKYAKTGSIDEAAAAIDLHMGVGLFALIAAAFVHSLVLTYFMGTGRWMEETSRAYRLPPEHQQESRALKYRIITAMSVCLVLLIITGALGAATGTRAFAGPHPCFPAWGISAGTLHFASSAFTVGLNLIVNVQEYQAIARNSLLVDQVLAEVRRIRLERGLPV